MYDLFKIDDEGNLVMKIKEARGIKAFKELIEADKGGKMEGDSDGRRKYYAIAQFKYMFFINHPDSIYLDLPVQEAKSLVLEKVELPENWKPSKKYLAAEQEYIEGMELSSTYKAYIEASRSIYSIGDDLNLFGEQRYTLKQKLKSISNKLALEEEGSEEYINLLKKEDAYTQRLMNLSSNIQKLTDGLPSSYDTLEKLKKILSKEKQSKAEVRGGGKIGNREE